jgi:hypothetical protein
MSRAAAADRRRGASAAPGKRGARPKLRALPDPLSAEGLLAGAGAEHRRVVAATLELKSGATAAEIAAELGSEGRLAALVEGLPDLPRALLCLAAFGAGRLSLSAYHRQDERAAAVALEHHGLLHAFGDRWSRTYLLPRDLVAPLRRALAARHATDLAGARPERLLAAPLQLAYDAAALAGHLQRSPARLKVDGDIYTRDWPKLLEALPPLEAGQVGQELREQRLELALAFLRDEGALRVQSDDRPGATPTRRLVPRPELAARLAGEPAAVRERLRVALDRYSDTGAALALADALAGQTVASGDLGRAAAGLLEENGTRVGLAPDDVALRAFAPAWLAGLVELGLNRKGRLSAVRLAPAPLEPAEAPAAVCQANFELVLLRPPTPGERLALESAAVRSPGQAHAFQITRAAVQGAARSGVLADGVVAALRRVAGELPQNVERSICEWETAARTLRLRTALFLDAGNAETAARLAAGPLAGLVVETLGEGLLALRGDSVEDAERLLREAGHELEPGLDRISGTWPEPAVAASLEAERAWRPRVREPAAGAPGKRVSTVDEAPLASAGHTGPLVSAGHAGPGLIEDPRDLDFEEIADGDPVDVLRWAIEQDEDVEIVYAGARGTTVRRVTPIELDASRLHAWCHLRDDARSFWLHSILEAAPVE